MLLVDPPPPDVPENSPELVVEEDDDMDPDSVLKEPPSPSLPTTLPMATFSPTPISFSEVGVLLSNLHSSPAGSAPLDDMVDDGVAMPTDVEADPPAAAMAKLEAFASGVEGW